MDSDKQKNHGLVEKYHDVIPYTVFGVLTTLVNILTYWLFAHFLHISIMTSTVLSWVLSVLFAYVTNRKWVFRSDAAAARAILREMSLFFSCRLATGALDWLNMFLFAKTLGWNDVWVKTISNVVVIIVNYAASKLLIFRHREG